MTSSDLVHMVFLVGLVFTSSAAGSRKLHASPAPNLASGYPFAFPPYLVNPFTAPGSANCADTIVGNFPSSGWAANLPPPFTIDYQEPVDCKTHALNFQPAGVSTRYTRACVNNDAACATACNSTTCMDAYAFDVVNFAHNFSLWNSTLCPNPTQLLGYGGIVPACTVETDVGVQVMMRLTNKIDAKKAAIDMAPFEDAIHPCNTTKRTGRPFSTHHHGSASLAPYDGWASDEVCFNETKDYIFPANRAATEWYHDHALDITAANAYWGLAGQFIVRDPETEAKWGLTNLPRRHLILSDKVFTKTCQLLKDEAKFHKENLYGDINLVSGRPWPVDRVEQTWYRFHILSAGDSRPWLLSLVGFNKATNQLDTVSTTPGACYVIASDGGWRRRPIPYPTTGLFMGVAERYEVVCNFAKFKDYGEVYLYNTQDTNRMKSVPFFCLSHLLMKFVIAQQATTTVDLALDQVPEIGTIIDNVVTKVDYNVSLARALADQYDRSFTFERRNGQWVINGETWFTHRVAAEDVGTNTHEIWRLNAGGGWFHPIHFHLIDFYVLHRTSGSYPKMDEYERNTPKDVVMLFPGATVYILARFGAHRGEYMFHCHNLIHEDAAMLRSFVDNTFNTTRYNEPGGDGDLYRNITRPMFDPDDHNPTGVKTLYDNYTQADLSPLAAAAPTDDPKWHADPLDGFTPGYVETQIMKGYYRIFYPLRADPVSDIYCKPTINKWLVQKQQTSPGGCAK